MKHCRRISTAVVAMGLAGLIGGQALAQVQSSRNPTGVNVSTSGPTSLAIRFASDGTGSFTTTQAQFCFAPLNADNSCNSANLIASLPTRMDRGSTSTATTAITDFMTIPSRVVRAAVVNARKGNFSDFFYVRRLDPSGGADFGNGAGQPVYLAVTCRLTGGTARTPLSLTRVELYGDEVADDRVRLLRVNGDNVGTGVIKADIDFTGVGIMAGWWEVRTPGDQEVRELDRFTAASLNETQRRQQHVFTRLKRFRVNMPASGRITLVGPKYEDLPRRGDGVHEVLLRVEVSREREQKSTLAGNFQTAAGGRANLFSGASAGFPLETLKYQITGTITGSEASFEPRLVVERDPGSGGFRTALAWKPNRAGNAIVQISGTRADTGEPFKMLAPVAKGFAVIPPQWVGAEPPRDLRVEVLLLGSNGDVLTDPVMASR